MCCKHFTFIPFPCFQVAHPQGGGETFVFRCKQRGEKRMVSTNRFVKSGREGPFGGEWNDGENVDLHLNGELWGQYKLHLTSFDPILSRDCNAPRKSPWEVEWVEVQFICSPKRRDFERIRLSCAMSYMCCMCQMSKFFAFKCLKFEPKLFRSNLWVIECQLLI